MDQQVIISGGGLVGATVALTLAEVGISSHVIDRDPLEKLVDPAMDGRTTAIALASKQLFDRLNVWQAVTDVACPINNITVYEKGSPWGVYFDHRELGSDPLGYIVDNPSLRKGLYQQVQNQSLISWHANTSIEKRHLGNAGVEVTLADGKTLEGALLIVAEGRQSQTCQSLGLEYRKLPYGQKGIVLRVAHEEPHNCVAWEVFPPEGPLAFLPLKDCPQTGAFQSGIVWALPTAVADAWFEKTDEEVAARLYEQFPHLGRLKVVGKRWIYPLFAQVLKTAIAPRVVVVGDAAHAYHPVAGQGVNVGWRDATTLTCLLDEQKKTGGDLGSATLLKRYDRERTLDAHSFLAMTDMVVRLFSNNSRSLSFLRTTGLGVVNNLPPLKRFFMKKAMGF